MTNPSVRLRRLASLLMLAVALGCAPDAEPDASEPGAGDALAALPAPMRPEPGSARPRVVLLISIDTLRADHLGVYGYLRPTSPVIDGLAREGIVFADASSTAPWTLPAHASMLSGLYPHRHGATDVTHQLPEDVPTLATILARRGYRTAAVVNSTKVSRLYDLSRGFQEFLYVPEVHDRISPSTWITDQAMDWLREFRDERLFLFVHYYDVHSDYASLPRYERQFVRPYDGKVDGSSAQLDMTRHDSEIMEMCRANPEHAFCRNWSRVRVVEFDEVDRQHLIDLYDAGIRQMDAELGRLVLLLRAEGLLDECLLILTSDHGEEFLEHGGLLHNLTQYQEMLHVPLILRGPGIPAGMRIETPVSLVDLAPTVLGALGEAPPILLDGLDLSPLWRSASESTRSEPEGGALYRNRFLFAEADFNRAATNNVVQAVRRGRYKLHRDRLTGKVELYDLETDPGEQADVSDRHPEVVEELLAALHGRGSGAPEGERVELSSEAIEQLKALGYYLPPTVDAP
ncbi:MAG: sulfatase-like hydrolase/transferase [Myxococcales bacterium]|nr:sulfatase-like hydrolase/transferase [Myxococcales bacterium]